MDALLVRFVSIITFRRIFWLVTYCRVSEVCRFSWWCLILPFQWTSLDVSVWRAIWELFRFDCWPCECDVSSCTNAFITCGCSNGFWSWNVDRDALGILCKFRCLKTCWAGERDFISRWVENSWTSSFVWMTDLIVLFQMLHAQFHDCIIVWRWIRPSAKGWFFLDLVVFAGNEYHFRRRILYGQSEAIWERGRTWEFSLCQWSNGFSWSQASSTDLTSYFDYRFLWDHLCNLLRMLVRWKKKETSERATASKHSTPFCQHLWGWTW